MTAMADYLNQIGIKTQVDMVDTATMNSRRADGTYDIFMVNLATYVGASQAGFLGAMVATFAVVLPSFLIVLAVTAVFYKAIKNKYVRAALQGIKPGMIGVIFATGCWMIIKNLFKDSFGEISIRAVIITAILG